MPASAEGRVGRVGGHPSIRGRDVFPVGVKFPLMPPAINSTQTIISLPVQTACAYRAVGALVVLVAVQRSVLDRISRRCLRSDRHYISAPNDHFTAGPHCRVKLRPVGVLVVFVGVQLSVLGLYLPPVLREKKWVAVDPTPNDHLMPVQTAV